MAREHRAFEAACIHVLSEHGVLRPYEDSEWKLLRLAGVFKTGNRLLW